MGCQTEVALGENLTFTITTHNPATAALTDADAAPIWRLYEDETAVPLLNGTMALLDGAGTTGFYSERVACTPANGFEDHRSYNIYVEATVNGVTGGISFGFRTIYEADTCATAVDFTYTVTDSGTGLPIQGVHVEISTDLAGVNVVWCGETDTFGVARDDNGQLPRLDPGTYYFWRNKPGYIFVNPDAEVVS